MLVHNYIYIYIHTQTHETQSGTMNSSLKDKSSALTYQTVIG